MRIPSKILAAAAALALASVVAVGAQAQAFSVTTTVDENGNGTLTNTNGFSAPLAFGLQNDPGPGGQANVLTYDLFNPPGLVSGDVLIDEPSLSGNFLGDVVRFNAGEVSPSGGIGSLVFYSDPVDGFDSLADTSSPPSSFYANQITLLEVGGRVIYTPTTGEPGFVAGSSGPVTYVLISDTAVPEPATWAMIILGVGAAGASLRARRKALTA